MKRSTHDQEPTESESANADGPNVITSEILNQECGIHKHKFGTKLFKSYGLGGFFKSKTAAEKLAKAEREWGSEARVIKVTNGWRVFLRNKPKRRS